MEFNWSIVFVSAIIPLVTGFVWYHPKVFGNAWMRASGINPDEGKPPHMALVFILTYIFSILMAMALIPVVVHQMGIFSTMADLPGIQDPATENGAMFKSLMDKYGHNFRTFKHGMFHGTLLGLFLAMPIIAINAMFEKRNAKYISINTGYWVVSLALMGGAICQWL